MWIYVRPASANILLEVETSAGDGDSPKRKEQIRFQVLPTDERDYLDLDTGEIFQCYSYARIRNKHQNLIGARLTIQAVSDDSDYKRNAMQYVDGIQGEFESFSSTIFFSLYVALTTFRELADNMKSGLLPETITVGFDRDPLYALADPLQKRVLEYGWEPDGSGKVWHNNERENRAVPIESIKFDYEILKPRHDQATSQLLPMMADLPSTRMNEQVASIQLILSKMSKHLLWAVVGIVALTVMVALWMVKHT